MKLIKPKIFDKRKVTASFSTKAYGPLVPFDRGDGEAYPNDVLQNRLHFLDDNKVQANHVVCMRQHHSSRVVTVDRRHASLGIFNKKKGIYADALITSKKDLALTVYASDCVPIYFYDTKKKVIAVVHAGWKGVSKKITTKVLEKMQQEFNSKTKDIQVWVAPHISSERYTFPKEDFGKRKVDSYFHKMGGVEFSKKNVHIDLGMIVEKELILAGVLKKNIEKSSQCTFNTKELYSYRKGDRGKAKVNNMGIIVMK